MQKRGDGLRVLFFVFVALLAMWILNKDIFTLTALAIIWKAGDSIWRMNYGKQAERGIDSLIAVLWPIVVLFEWQTFDENVADDRQYCEHCHRPLAEIILLRAECANQIQFPAGDDEFKSRPAKYCIYCDEAPHVRWVTCRRGRKPCENYNCYYRK